MFCLVDNRIVCVQTVGEQVENELEITEIRVDGTRSGNCFRFSQALVDSQKANCDAEYSAMTQFKVWL